MSVKSNIKKVQKIMKDRKKEIRNRHLNKNPDKAALENTLFDAADAAKEAGIQ